MSRTSEEILDGLLDDAEATGTEGQDEGFGPEDTIVIEEEVEITGAEGRQAYEQMQDETREIAKAIEERYMEDTDGFQATWNEGLREETMQAFGTMLALTNLWSKAAPNNTDISDAILHGGAHALGAISAIEACMQKVEDAEDAEDEDPDVED